MAGEWDGRPERPDEDDTWHWLRGRFSKTLYALLWHDGVWVLEDMTAPPADAALGFSYEGPCLTPDAVAAAVAQAVAAEREACAEVAASRPEVCASCGAHYSGWCNTPDAICPSIGDDYAAAIRARGDTDALAEVRAQARRKGIEAALAKVKSLHITELRHSAANGLAQAFTAIRALIEEPSRDAK